ncbi:MAG TPA: hypothetical protein DCP97_04305 [Ruminococcaceae bacterium]|nr:hypothetical protein [Oscillospiraceae bacterium]
MNIKIDELADAIALQLSQFKDGVAEQVKAACTDVSNDMTDKIKASSPVGKGKTRGKYKRGWRVKKMFEDKDNIRYKIYNATDYQLTHLLEFGHAKTNGGRVEGRPHIRPNEEWAKKELAERIKRVVQQ